MIKMKTSNYNIFQVYDTYNIGVDKNVNTKFDFDHFYYVFIQGPHKREWWEDVYCLNYTEIL